MTSAQSSAQASPDSLKAEAEQRLNQGNAQFNRGQFEAALQSAQQALTLYRQLQDRLGEGKALGNLGLAYAALGNYPKAIELQQQRLTLTQELQDRLGEAQALGSLGNIYTMLGNYSAAIEFHQQSLALGRQIPNRAVTMNALGNLGNLHYFSGNYAQALDNHQQSLALAQQAQDRRSEGRVLGNLGLVYEALGNYAKAIELQQHRLSITREMTDRQGEQQALGNLGNLYQILGDYNLATAYYQQSLMIAQQLKDRLGEGNVLGNLGLVYTALGDYTKAIQYQQQRLRLAQEIQHRLGERLALVGLGINYRALGQYPQAIAVLQQSLTIARQMQDRWGENQALANLGIVHDAMGDYRQAIAYQRESLAISRQMNNPLGTASSLNNLGLSLFRAGQLVEAAATLLASIELYESLRLQLSDASRAAFADTQRQAYQNLQQVLVAQDKMAQALEIAERGRARAFVQLLASRQQQQIPQAEQQVPAIDIAQMRQIAQTQKATLVSYSMIYDEQLLIWVISPKGEVALRPIDLKPLRQEKTSLDRLVVTARCFGEPDCEQSIIERRPAAGQPSLRETRSLVFNPTLASRTVESSQAVVKFKNPHLQRLHQLLIDPIAPLLPQDPQAEIIFIPQGSLFLAPFAALQDAAGRYFIERYTLRIVPAIQVLQFTRAKRQKVRQSNLTAALVVGNPTMPQMAIKPGTPPVPLSSLPGAQVEAETIAPLLNTRALVGAQATKAVVIEQMSRARIIHLATHGKADDQQGLQSWVALAPSGQDSGFLTAGEIMNLTLNAELVVLSACETGQGQITGDGVVGLSRAIISAGVPSVLVSLWVVPDAPTAFLMTEFYRRLKQQPNKSVALRQAMLTTQQAYPHPRDWSAFVLIGEAE